MTYRGTVKDGVIVLEGLDELPEGADVLIRVEDPPMTAEEKVIMERQRAALLRLAQLGEENERTTPQSKPSELPPQDAAS